MLHTTGKENLSLFILLVLFIIDINTLQAIGNSKISLAKWSTRLNFILHAPSYIFFVRHQRDTWTVWNSRSLLNDWCVLMAFRLGHSQAIKSQFAKF